MGGNLSIASLQDSSTYTGKQQNFGGSLSIGYGNMSGSISASKSNVDSSYQSVSQQSGIKAGDGGFEVNVKGNTDLKGAVIASTDKAANETRNTFTTGGTLTASDIQNSASFEGKSVGISIGAGQSAKTAGIQGVGVGIGSDKGDASSITTSGISGMAANTAVRSTDPETGIARIFDADKVQKEINAQTQITQAFSREAPKAVASYAASQAADLQAQARKEPDAEKKAALQAEAVKWDEGGVYRIALHTATGALGGGLSGAAGAAASASAAPLINELQDGLQKNLQNAGLSAVAAKGIAQSVAGLTAAGAGAAVGGAQGGATALTVDANNRQLHPTEIQWIKGNAASYAKQKVISLDAAERQLAEQAFRQVQFGAEGGVAAWDTDAQNFLKSAVPQSLSGGGFMFYATPDQKADTTMYLNSAISNADFYAKNGLKQPTQIDLQNAAQRDAQIRANLGTATKTAFAASASIALAGLAPTTLGWAMSHPMEATAAGIITSETAAAITSGAVTSASLAPTVLSTTTKFVAQYGPASSEGPLAINVINTFRSGTYSEVLTTAPTTLYRAYGGTAQELGGYWTSVQPTGPVQSIVDSALSPVWGNTATKIVKIEIPAGTTIYTGTAAQQGGLVGGGNQVLLQKNLVIDPTWIRK